MKRRVMLTGLLLCAGATTQAAKDLSARLLERVTSACVLVQVSKGRTGAAGSGFFINRSDVVTNEHVVRPAIEGEAEITLVIGGGSKKPRLARASLVAVDAEHDLALLRAEYKSRATLSFESERRLRVTEPVWVVGFPFGAAPGLEATVTSGTISSLRRDEDGALQKVQIDAAVNRGNSGGPVVNALGKVVGITRAVINPKVGSGMAVAIPCGVAESFADAGRRKRLRKAILRVRGRVRQRGLRIVRAEKLEEAWGTAARFTVRGSRGADEVNPLAVEFVNRRREVLHRGTLDVGDLKPREEKVIEIRLRGVEFGDVAGCNLVE